MYSIKKSIEILCESFEVKFLDDLFRKNINLYKSNPRIHNIFYEELENSVGINVLVNTDVYMLGSSIEVKVIKNKEYYEKIIRNKLENIFSSRPTKKRFKEIKDKYTALCDQITKEFHGR